MRYASNASSNGNPDQDVNPFAAAADSNRQPDNHSNHYADSDANTHGNARARFN
jgi:hypothetical protein